MSQRSKARVRTLHGVDHQSGRFRPETVVVSERPRLTAKIGEFCIARQMARLEAHEQHDR